MKIIIAADPFAMTLKKAVVEHLLKAGHEIIDYGATETKEIPYYESCVVASKALRNDEAPFAILFCGTGMGMSMIANRFKGVRAAVVESVYAASMTRSINDANALCLGSMIWGDMMACNAVDAFLNTNFTDNLPAFADYLKEAIRFVERIEDK